MPKQSTKMSGLQCLATDTVWFDKQRYDEAEKCFYAGASGASTQAKTALLQPKAPAQKRRHRNALVGSPPGGEGRHSVSLTPASNTTQANSCALIVPQSSSHAGDDQELVARMKSVELENHTLHKVVEEMRAALQKLESRVVVLEKSPAAAVTCVKVAPVKQVQVENGDDDDVDLFGSDDEEDDEETERLKQERIDAYAAKKSKKPTLIAKSSILLDVKPWDDETDMAKLEECVRSVQMDGLLWGSGKLVAVGYGIKKLQINCVVEDDKVGTDILEEELTKFEDYVQSVDVAAFNKI